MTREVMLTRGKCALVDDEDHKLVVAFSWQARPCDQASEKWYAQRGGLAGGTVYMHRLILDAPPHLLVDHINGDGLDNRRANLRLCTARQNSIHRSYSNRSGYRGVYRHSAGWRVVIESEGRAYRLGSYRDPADAARVYDAKARELHGEFAVLNFPDVAQ